ncbi:MAG: hypothetical protein JXO22_16395 [Phycisphaerae bacterium]|nr:hypothetical protein [Phycisphaerae bacterium]
MTATLAYQGLHRAQEGWIDVGVPECAGAHAVTAADYDACCVIAVVYTDAISVGDQFVEGKPETDDTKTVGKFVKIGLLGDSEHIIAVFDVSDHERPHLDTVRRPD